MTSQKTTGFEFLEDPNHQKKKGGKFSEAANKLIMRENVQHQLAQLEKYSKQRSELLAAKGERSIFDLDRIMQTAPAEPLPFSAFSSETVVDKKKKKGKGTVNNDAFDAELALALEVSRAAAEAEGLQVAYEGPSPGGDVVRAGRGKKKGPKMVVRETVYSDDRLVEEPDLPQPVKKQDASSPIKEEEKDDFLIREPEEVTKKDKKKKKKEKEKQKGPDTEQWNKMAVVQAEESNRPAKKRKGALAFDAKNEKGTGDMDDFNFYDGEKPLIGGKDEKDDFPDLSEVNKKIAAMES